MSEKRDITRGMSGRTVENASWVELQSENVRAKKMQQMLNPRFKFHKQTGHAPLISYIRLHYSFFHMGLNPKLNYGLTTF